MKLTSDVVIGYVDEKMLEFVRNMHERDIDFLEGAIHVSKLERMARRLNAKGFNTRTHSTDHGDGVHHFNYILVYDPAEKNPGEWATLNEAQRLLDTVANLEPVEAFQRWRDKIESVISEPYTEADARRDMAAERAMAQTDYQARRGTVEDLAIAHIASRDFLDYVETVPDDLITQAQAAQLGAPSVQAINNAIRDGRLRGYPNYDTKYQRQGATLVSELAVRNLWDITSS